MAPQSSVCRESPATDVANVGLLIGVEGLVVLHMLASLEAPAADVATERSYICMGDVFMACGILFADKPLCTISAEVLVPLLWVGRHIRFVGS